MIADALTYKVTHLSSNGLQRCFEKEGLSSWHVEVRATSQLTHKIGRLPHRDSHLGVDCPVQRRFKNDG